eukprot:TRINITY_DN691_c0_g1_i1.p1 TRINITY_DN691_c0_g1~~TRINITY_DN691_c0_g1_i1.p1  ORF type:complete len:449 (-),score=123.78 TRINITY_DN691_c0_g1_i1:41-1315(-)
MAVHREAQMWALDAHATSTHEILGKIPEAPADPILGLNAAFNADSSPNKVNLGMGAYRTAEGKPWVLPVIKKVEKKILEDASLNKEYLPIDGLQAFCVATAKLMLGDASSAIAEKRIATVQTLSGTGGLRVVAEFIKDFFPKDVTMWISNPTWSNHVNIFKQCGLAVKEYRYFSAKTNAVDIDNLLADLSAAKPHDVVLLHACAHNPTGADPTREQWEQILKLFQAKKLFPFFDSAYQGFATGDLIGDAFAVRLFEQHRIPLAVVQSYAKNMGLYGERIGALSVVTSTPEEAQKTLSQLKRLIRSNYSSPQLHGARLVAAVLSDPALFAQWQTEVKIMADRIIAMRTLLFENLKKLGTPGDWSHILKQIGMFTYTGLSPTQCDLLISKHHIYLTRNGRVSMAGVTPGNVAYVAQAIHDVVTTAK